jgi:hypothetical protein
MLEHGTSRVGFSIFCHPLAATKRQPDDCEAQIPSSRNHEAQDGKLGAVQQKRGDGELEN